MASADPFSNVSVTHLSRMRRRRSQSVMLPDSSNRIWTQGQRMRRKEFLELLRNERLRQNEQGTNIDVLDKELNEEPAQPKDDHYQAVVSRISRPIRIKTAKTQIDSAGVSVSRIRKDLSSRSIKVGGIESDVIDADHLIPSTQLSPFGLTLSLQNSNPMIRNATSISNSSEASTTPLGTSTANLIPKSKVIGQGNSSSNTADETTQINNIQVHTTKQISEREKRKHFYNNMRYATPSVNFMAGIIGIALGLIAFAFGIASLILVLLLRATVDAQLANSTSSSSSGTGTLPAACSSYTTLDDPTRNIGASGYALGCDNTPPFLNRSMPVWIRFMGTGGSTLPLQTPGMNLCGSVGTGWYNGQMPSSTGAMVNGSSCFTWYNNICQFSSSITVANCGDFYIYKLPPPPACMMRYCTI